MIATIKRNWKEIKRLMILSQKSHYDWFTYSQKISNGLSNNLLTKRGCGNVIFFVERLNQYADDLKGGIILNIGNIKADNVETVSKIISNIGENQSIQIEMITRNGQAIRLII